MKRLALLLPASLLLSGCLGDVMSVFCETGPDSDHCYQTAAVQEAEPENCEKIGGEGFTGSNPPKDKCHLMIAENTGDPSVCDNIEGGFMSYSQEECLAGVFKDHTVEDCTNAKNEAACRATYAKNGKGCGAAYVFNESAGTCDLRTESQSSSEPFDHDDIEDKVGADLNTMKEAATGKYMELLEEAIENETDPDTLHGLQAYKEFLDSAGEKLETAETSLETLKDLKRLFLDAYDPKMNIEYMPVDKILGKGFFDKVKDGLFGEDKPEGAEKENADADDALTVYEAMLKRQEEIDFLKKGKLERVGDTVVSKIKDKAVDTVKENAEEIAKAVAGEAFGAVGTLSDAIDSFKEAAQKEMFIGLARAYNRRRDALAAQQPNLSPEDLHKLTVQQVQEDPYRDNTNTGFIKHGNLLENKDCQDESNPLCIDNRVFWTAMDKTYVHNHK